jgi:hypothetical protein
VRIDLDFDLITVDGEVNQADVVFGGRATAWTWVKIGLSYSVPFFVANYGIVLGSRRSRPR